MRERAIEQFESIFERASIPVLDIREVALRRIALVLKNDPLNESTLKLAAYLQKRFAADVRVHWPASVAESLVAVAESEHGFGRAAGPFESTAALIGQVALSHSQLVLIPEPEDEGARIVDTDALVKGSAPPILLLRQPVEHPQAVFQNILHSLSGNFQQTANFSYSFALVEDQGTLRLLHAIDHEDLAAVREAMQVSTESATPTRRRFSRNWRIAASVT